MKLVKQDIDKISVLKEYPLSILQGMPIVFNILNKTDRSIYNLKETNYWLIISWKLMFTTWHCGTYDNGFLFITQSVSFETILNDADKASSLDELLFHLDLFRNAQEF